MYLKFPSKVTFRGQFPVKRKHTEPLCRRLRPGHDQLGRDLRRHDGRTVAGSRFCRAAIGGRRPGRGPRDASFVPLPARAGRVAAGRAAFALDCGRGSPRPGVPGAPTTARGRLLRPRSWRRGAGAADQLGQVVAVSLGRRPHGRASALARGGRRPAAVAGRGQCARTWPTSAPPGTPASRSIRWPSRISCSRCRPRSTKWPGS